MRMMFMYVYFERKEKIREHAALVTRCSTYFEQWNEIQSDAYENFD